MTRAPAASQSRLFTTLVGTLLIGALAGCSGGAGHPTESLPKGFPTAVPVATTSVVSSEKAGDAWAVKVKVDGDKGQQAALQKLKDKGFVVIGTSGANSADRTYSLANSSYSVRIGFERSKGDHFVTYGVSARGTGAK